MRTYKKIFIVLIVVVLSTSLLVVNCNAWYTSALVYGPPEVYSPRMLLRQLPSEYEEKRLVGFYFQEETGNPFRIISQSIDSVYSTDGSGVMNSNIPNNFRYKSHLLQNGWYNKGSEQLGRVHPVGGIQCNNRDYFSIGFGFSFQEFPVYAGYVNFEIILYAPNGYNYWVNDTLDPEAERQYLRFDSGDDQLLGLGYFNGPYFVLKSKNTVYRLGDDWLKLNMKVQASDLPLITTLNLAMNATSSFEGQIPTISSDAKQGTLYLDFYMSSLIAYPDNAPEYIYTPDGEIVEKNPTIQMPAVPDFDEIIGEGNSIIVAGDIGDYAVGWFDSLNSNVKSFWANTIGSIMNFGMLAPITVVGSFLLITKALLGR